VITDNDTTFRQESESVDGDQARVRLSLNMQVHKFTNRLEFSNSCGGCSWGDYDNDGFIDLFVSGLDATTLGESALFHNTGNSNHWLKVKCVGVASNRMAIGAKVRVRAIVNGSQISQLREISTGDGFGNGA
jgi:hypothetical protein